MKRTAAIALTGLLIFAAAIVGAVRLGAGAVYTDADTIRVPAVGAPVRDILWQPATPLPLPIWTEADEYEPSLSADGMTLYFVRGRAGENADIFVSSLTPDGWSEPAPLAAVNSAGDELGPAVSSDGRALYFYSDRAGGQGGYDLWVAPRVDDGWGEPQNLGPAVNTAFNEYGPGPTPDGRQLYFASNRPRPGDPERDLEAWPATLREQRHRNDYDIYVAGIDAGAISAPVPLAAINTAHNDGCPRVSPFGDFLYFASDRPGGSGGYDLYRARRLRGGHTAPENLGIAINSYGNDLDPALSLGGYAIMFSTNGPRPAGSEASPAGAVAGEAGELARAYDLYQSTSREVFRETEPMLSGLDWSSALPLLWWLLLALLLLLLLLSLPRAARSAQFRKLSLLAKCLLLSFLLHLLILLGLTLWQVGVGLDRYFREPGRGVISVNLPSTGDDISDQLRAGAADAPLPAPAAIQTPRLTADLPTNDSSTPAPPDSTVEPVTVEVAALPSPTAGDAQPPPPAPATTSPSVPTSQPISTSLPAPPTAVATTEPATPAVNAPSLPGVSRVEAALPADTAHSPPPLPAAASAPRPSPSASAAMDAAAQPTMESPTPSSATPPMPTQISAVATPRVSPASATAEAVLAAPPQPALPATRAELTSETPDVSRDVLTPAPQSMPRAAAEHAAHVVPPAPSDSAPTGSQISQTAIGSPPQETLLAPAGPVPPAPASTRAQREASQELDSLQSAALSPVRRVPLPPVADAGPASTDPTAAAVHLPPAMPAPAFTSTAPTDAAPPASTNGRAVARLEPTDAPMLAAIPAPQFPARRAGSDRAAETRDTPVTPANAASPPPLASSRPSLPAAPGELPSLTPHDLPGRRPVQTGAADPVALAASPADAPTNASDTAAAKSSHSPSVTAAQLPTLDVAFSLPSLPAARTDAYSQRAPEVRAALVERLGGSDETERAVALALEWLSRHQSPDGSWSSSGFEDRCGQCGGTSKIKSDVALTGLALLCFLGADHTHTKEGPYKDTVARALRWLLARQSDSGDLRDGETMYSQGIAAIALSEAYGMTGDASLRDAVEQATNFIVGARSATAGGWRYDPGQPGDTSVLGWMVLAMTSAKRGGVDVPQSAFDGAADWLSRVSWPQRPGVYAYQPGLPFTPSMTAEGLFVQQLLGQDREHPATRGAIDYLADHPPSWRRDAATYYWYYATLALFQHQGEPWDKWNTALKRELLAHQRTTGPAAGSWDPKDKYSSVGGRVYQTAICTLCLEVYYRYLPMYTPAPEP